jgi:hypothetical protein
MDKPTLVTCSLAFVMLAVPLSCLVVRVGIRLVDLVSAMGQRTWYPNAPRPV